MPSRKTADHTTLLVPIPDDVHAAANARRRRERVTWSTVVTTLLRRWAAGDEAAITRPVRVTRPATPDAAQAERLHQHAMATNEAYRRACVERVDPAELTWHRGLGALFAATAAREGRLVTPEVLAAIDDDEGGDG